MTATEADKHDLFQALVDRLGKRRAETFMDMVSTVPWSEVATRSDLERFASKADLERFATKADVRAATERMGRRMAMWVGGLNLVLVGLTLAVARTI